MKKIYIVSKKIFKKRFKIQDFVKILTQTKDQR